MRIANERTKVSRSASNSNIQLLHFAFIFSMGIYDDTHIDHAAREVYLYAEALVVESQEKPLRLWMVAYI